MDEHEAYMIERLELLDDIRDKIKKRQEVQSLNERLKAKVTLYNLLLHKGDPLTDCELNVMYELSQDNQVQRFIDEGL